MHCADWASRGLSQSCTADIDPDGDGQFSPVQVECDFDTEPGKAVTIMRKCISFCQGTLKQVNLDHICVQLTDNVYREYVEYEVKWLVRLCMYMI